MANQKINEIEELSDAQKARNIVGQYQAMLEKLPEIEAPSLKNPINTSVKIEDIKNSPSMATNTHKIGRASCRERV